MSNQEDRNCRADRKPYYHVAEAAVFWCNIRGRTIQVDDAGLPLNDSQNPCLRVRAQEIMFAIDEGILPCGRDGKTVNEHVARPRRTVRHVDLKEWIGRNFPGEKPPFLFDEVERQTHSAINVDTYRALKAAHDAKEKRLDDAQEKIRLLNEKLHDTETERDLLRTYSASSSLSTRERRSLLVVLQAAFTIAKIDSAERGLAVAIAQITQGLGAPVSDDTIRKFLQDIPDALESRAL